MSFGPCIFLSFQLSTFRLEAFSAEEDFDPFFSAQDNGFGDVESNPESEHGSQGSNSKASQKNQNDNQYSDYDGNYGTDSPLIEMIFSIIHILMDILL